MRWILLTAALGAFALAFSTKSTGFMTFALIVGFGLFIAALLSFAAAKIAATSRPDTTLLTDKDINALRASIRKPAPQAPTAAQSTPRADE